LSQFGSRHDAARDPNPYTPASTDIERARCVAHCLAQFVCAAAPLKEICDLQEIVA